MICRESGISEATFYKWKSRYGGMSVSEAKRARELENEQAPPTAERERRRSRSGTRGGRVNHLILPILAGNATAFMFWL